MLLTVLVKDVVDLLEGEALRALGDADDEGDGLDGHEARGRGRGVRVLRDGQGAAVGVLELDFEDAVLLRDASVSLLPSGSIVSTAVQDGGWELLTPGG